MSTKDKALFLDELFLVKSPTPFLLLAQASIGKKKMALMKKEFLLRKRRTGRDIRCTPIPSYPILGKVIEKSP